MPITLPPGRQIIVSGFPGKNNTATESDHSQVLRDNTASASTPPGRPKSHRIFRGALFYRPSICSPCFPRIEKSADNRAWGASPFPRHLVGGSRAAGGPHLGRERSGPGFGGFAVKFSRFPIFGPGSSKAGRGVASPGRAQGIGCSRVWFKKKAARAALGTAIERAKKLKGEKSE